MGDWEIGISEFGIIWEGSWGNRDSECCREGEGVRCFGGEAHMKRDTSYHLPIISCIIPNHKQLQSLISTFPSPISSRTDNLCSNPLFHSTPSQHNNPLPHITCQVNIQISHPLTKFNHKINNHPMSFPVQFQQTRRSVLNSSSRLRHQLPFSTPRELSKRSQNFPKPFPNNQNTPEPTRSIGKSLSRSLIRSDSRSISRTPIKQVIHLSSNSKSPIQKRWIQVPEGTSDEVITTLNNRFKDFEKSVKRRLERLEERSRKIAGLREY